MVKDRTIIEFGIPGDEPTITHIVEGNSLLIEEILDNPNGVKVGQYTLDPELTHTGRQFELKFESPESVASVIERLLHIGRNLIAEREVERRKEWIKNFGQLQIALIRA